jgi:probable F420-dependent oxidoreductase
VRQPRLIRFGTGGGRGSDPVQLISLAQRAEEIGYATFGMADHFMTALAPLVALQAVADATEKVRLTQIVLAQDFRHPAVLAKELATLDVLSGGRLEVGLGAGWMRSEFEQAGIPFDRASVRIERLEEAVLVLKGLFADEPLNFSGRHFTIRDLDGTPKPVQRPGPPIMIGGGGPRLLAAAARRADIVQVLPGSIRGDMGLDPASVTADAYGEKLDWIRDAAGPRFDEIELGALLLNVTITDDPDSALDEFLERFAPSARSGRTAGRTRHELFASPMVAIGSLEQVCDKLRETRDHFGFSYFAPPVGASMQSLAPVVERLTGS